MKKGLKISSRQLAEKLLVQNFNSAWRTDLEFGRIGDKVWCRWRPSHRGNINPFLLDKSGTKWHRTSNPCIYFDSMEEARATATIAPMPNVNYRELFGQ